jgi:hypothetical protein
MGDRVRARGTAPAVDGARGRSETTPGMRPHPASDQKPARRSPPNEANGPLSESPSLPAVSRSDIERWFG